MTTLNPNKFIQDATRTGKKPSGSEQNWLAIGGVFGALAASSCCILPLGLTLLGVSGAWMGNLRAMAPYQPFFILLAVGSISYGFYNVYRKPVVSCAEGKVCAHPMGGNIVKLSLWLGTILIITSLTFSLWFPLIVPYLP